jgi:hypothetical protein
MADVAGIDLVDLALAHENYFIECFVAHPDRAAGGHTYARERARSVTKCGQPGPKFPSWGGLTVYGRFFSKQGRFRANFTPIM